MPRVGKKTEHVENHEIPDQGHTLLYVRNLTSSRLQKGTSYFWPVLVSSKNLQLSVDPITRTTENVRGLDTSESVMWKRDFERKPHNNH